MLLTKNKIIGAFISAVLIFSLFVSIFNFAVATTGFPTGWSNRKALSVSQAAGANTNFQIDVVTHYGSGVDSANNFYLDSLCQTDFDDIRFTASDGSTLLDIANSTIYPSDNATWAVEISANLTAASTTIYLYYGNPSASSVSNEVNTFISVIDDVLLAMPMKEGTGTSALDTSGNGNDAEFVGVGQSWVAGKFGNYAIGLNGSGWLDVGSSLIGANGTFTALTWFNSTADQYLGLISQDAEVGSDRQWFVAQTTPNRNLVRVYDEAAGAHSGNSPSGSLGLNAWMQAGIIYDYSTGNVGDIQNGTVTNVTTSASLIAGTPTNTRIGMHYNPFYAFKGSICYPIIINSALSAQQVSDIYNNYPDSTFDSGKICVRKYLVSPPSVTIASDSPLPINVSEYGFSIIQISDTQFLSTDYYGWSSFYTDLTEWIADNANDLNLKAVIHTGDITDADSASDWTNANTSMSVLLNADIPYSIDAGNHDQTPNNDPDGTSRAYQYTCFNSTYLSTKPYWVSDILTGKNTAIKFTYEDFNFLVINMEFLANSTVMDWTTNLLNTYTDYNIIVATHSYRNSTGGYGYFSYEYDWCQNLKTLMDSHSNVFMVLSGHDISGTAYNEMVGTREEIMFNRQGEDNKTGASTARIYTFNMTDKTVQAYTYKIYESPHLITGDANAFSFTATLTSGWAHGFKGIPNDKISSVCGVPKTSIGSVGGVP